LPRVIRRSFVIPRTDDRDGLRRLAPDEKLALIAEMLDCRPEALMNGDELSGQVGEAAHLLRLFLDIKAPENRRALLEMAAKLASA